MQFTQLPLELISIFLSIILLVTIFIKFYQYKRKLVVLKGLNELKEKNRLTSEDIEFIKSNYKDYASSFSRDEQRLKIFYPAFILAAGVLIAFLSFEEAMIHINVIVVAYIFLHINKIHARNFVSFLKELNTDI
ncbi:MAG: hypothetical protein GY932_06370 [Arcobacter sp.]|nr:hypothetical protein [Arcobacter sp.]